MLKFVKVNTDLQILRFYKYLYPIHDTILPPMEMFVKECKIGIGMVYLFDNKIVAGLLCYPVEKGWMEIDQLHIDKEFRDGVMFRRFYKRVLLISKEKNLKIRCRITNKDMIEKLGHILEPMPDRGEHWWKVNLEKDN